MRLGDIANDGRGAVRQAARRRARPRRSSRCRRCRTRTQLLARLGADVVKVEHPSAASRAAASQPGDGRPRGPHRRRHVPAQQPQQAQRRHRPEGAGGPRPRAPRWRPRFDVVAENFKAGHDGPPRASATTTIAAVHPAVDLRVGLGLRQHGRLAVPRLAGVRVDRRGDVGHLRVQARAATSRRVADPGRRARRHRLRRCSR